MKAVNKTGQATLDKLTAGLDANNRSRTLDSDRGFMPLHVEYLFTTKTGPVYSLAHYYRQNGDSMRDPDMEFLKSDDGRYYPLSFRQDNLGIMQEDVLWNDDGTIKGCYTRRQRDHATFAGLWMANIRAQQNVSQQEEN